VSLRIRVLIAEDRPIVADGLKAALTAAADVSLTAMVTSRSVENEARRYLPDVIIADPACGILDANLGCNPRLVAFTAIEDAQYMHSLFQAGMTGYVCLRSPPADIVRAIRVVAAGEMFVDSIMAARLVGSAQGDRDEDTLSSRELSVIKLVAWGLTDKEIAYNLGVSVKSISSYKQRAVAKLGIRSRADIVRLAIRRNWLVQAAEPCRDN
jgi:DNA-binding NarL/FixJ family response regulator